MWLKKIFKPEKKKLMYTGRTSREVISGIVLPIVNKAGIVNVTSAYQITFFTANDANLQKAVKYIEAGRYKKLSSLMSTIPLDFGYVFNHVLYHLYYVVADAKCYFVIIFEDESETASFKDIVFRKEIILIEDIETYAGAYQIYPVQSW